MIISAKKVQKAVSARKALKSARVKPGPKLPLSLQWTVHFTDNATSPDAGGSKPPRVRLATRLYGGRLEIDLNDGRVATVDLEPSQLLALGQSGITAAFTAHKNALEAVQKSLAKTAKGRKAKRRGA